MAPKNAITMILKIIISFIGLQPIRDSGTH